MREILYCAQTSIYQQSLMRESKDEAEITLSTTISADQIPPVETTLGHAKTIAQFYIGLILCPTSGKKQKTAVDQTLIPEALRKQLDEHFIPSSSLDSLRIRYCQEDPTSSSWTLTAKETEREKKKKKRKERHGLPSSIRMEHDFPVSAADIRCISEANAITGLVIKSRYDLMKLYVDAGHPHEGLSSISMDILQTPLLTREDGLEPAHAVRLEAEFMDRGSMNRYLKKHDETFVSLINEILFPMGLSFGNEKPHGQKIMALEAHRILTEMGMSSNAYLQKIYENSSQGKITPPLLSFSIDESRAAGKRSKNMSLYGKIQRWFFTEE